MEHLYSLPPLEKALIIKRPSKHIKSPYVADIEIDGKMYLGHTPSLGCCGLAEAGSYVMVNKTTGTKCDYRIQHSVKTDDDGSDVTIGIAPKLAEKLIESALEKNIIEGLDVDEFGREKKRLNSRFDFIGKTKENKEFILEVKNVPLADYEDIEAKERKKRDYTGWNCKDKIAYFPDGYRKKKTQTVSERALKHVNELTQIKKEHPESRCILMFVIQRTDVTKFQPSIIDPIYRDAIKEANDVGVEIMTFNVEWKGNDAFATKNKIDVLIPTE